MKLQCLLFLCMLLDVGKVKTELNTDDTHSPSSEKWTRLLEPSEKKYSLKGIFTKQYLTPQMVGVNRAGFEYVCTQGWGMMEGPTDDDSVQAMKKWNIEIVRLPLNEDCWLGINGFSDAFSGENYRNAVADYVDQLRRNGIKVILDLHYSDGLYSGPGWVECKDFRAMCKKPMPDAENAPKFWKSLANQFKNDEGIIFDLFNSPEPDKAIYNRLSAWSCWKNGGDACSGFQYKVVGMQDLVNVVRETGADNPLLIAGIRSANDLSEFLKFVPFDPKNKIIASWHSWKDHQCNNELCWEKEITPVANSYPLIVSEIGEPGCSYAYSTKLMKWLDKKNISYLSWTWNTWDCSSGGLISDYKGTPTEYGKGLYSHISAKRMSSTSLSSKRKKKTLSKQLRGVNRSGAEYSCVKNLGIFEGPIDETSVKNMKKWKINVVRIPLNEDCWLGINGHRADLIGENYRNAVIKYVNLLRENGLSVILDLHWSGGYYDGAGHGECIDKTAKCQKPMPDAEYAPMFWESVAIQFKNDDNIIFDLYNEPFPDMIYWDKKAAWKCWRNGGNDCPDFPFRAAGMQDLVDAVRNVGATNPVMIGGINWSSDLSGWKEHVPVDPLNKIVASWHAYALNQCNNTKCWKTMIGPIAKEYSVVVGEMGETDCTHEYIDQLMRWLDQYKISYVGWTWNTWDCRLGPALISDYDGTPSDFGQGLMKHLQKTSRD